MTRSEPTSGMRFPWLLTVFTVALLVLLIGLGVWQVQRLHWKEGLIDSAEAAASEPPRPLAEVLTAPDPEFRRALVVCRGLATAPYIELQTILDGEPGSRLISVCKPEGLAATYLVDRGFVAETVSARPRILGSTLPLSILVELRRTPGPGLMAPPASDGRFFTRDSAGIAAALGAPQVSAYTLFALASTNPEFGALRASAPPPAFANNHLGYAMTWFGLAIVLVGFYVAMLRRRRRASSRRDRETTT